MAWGLDLKLPPPHFIRFAHLALLVGACFGFLLTLFLAPLGFLLWRSLGLLFAAATGLGTGAWFGLCMAVYYTRSAAKLKLPSWERYPEA